MPGGLNRQLAKDAKGPEERTQGFANPFSSVPDLAILAPAQKIDATMGVCLLGGEGHLHTQFLELADEIVDSGFRIATLVVVGTKVAEGLFFGEDMPNADQKLVGDCNDSELVPASGLDLVVASAEEG